jgi:hypothetical protein
LVEQIWILLIMATSLTEHDTFALTEIVRSFEIDLAKPTSSIARMKSFEPRMLTVESPDGG